MTTGQRRAVIALCVGRHPARVGADRRPDRVVAEAALVTSSRRALAILLAITAVLAAVLWHDLARPVPVPVDHALVPGFDPAAATALVWKRDAGSVRIMRLARVANHWVWQEPTPGEVDGRAFNEVMSTLRAATWHRTAEPRVAWPIHAELTIEGPVTHRLQLGKELEGSEQAWIVDDGRALLVDRWVARALDPDPLALRIRHPFENVATAHLIKIASADPGAGITVELAGLPRVLAGPTPILVADEHVRALEAALSGLEVRAISPSAPASPRGGFTLQVGDRTAQLDGACPGDPQLARVRGAFGDGCVAREAFTAVQDAVRALAAGPVEVAEPRPAPIEATAITLVDHGELHLEKRPQIDGRDADLARVAELVLVLRTPATRSAVAMRDAAPPRMVSIVDRGGSRITLELLGANRVRRVGEPVALTLTPASYAILLRGAAGYRDPQLWLEEPTTISELRIDGTTFHRANGGGWVRTDGAVPDAARTDELVAMLAAPRAIGMATPGGATAHVVTIVVTPPVGAPVTHMLELGVATQAGCPARFEGEPVLLPRALCDRIKLGT